MLDSEFLVKFNRFRIGDLSNILPAGIKIDGEYRDWDEPIVYFLKIATNHKTDKYFFLENEEYGQYMRKKAKVELEQMSENEKLQRMTEEEREDHEMSEKDHEQTYVRTTEKKERRVRHVSLKKQVKNMSSETKEEFLKKAWKEKDEARKKSAAGKK